MSVWGQVIHIHQM
ncbi:rCG35987, partial [Rattus norvegicus]